MHASGKAVRERREKADTHIMITAQKSKNAIRFMARATASNRSSELSRYR